MSALCIITTPDEVVIATDGGSFNADGSLAGLGSKVLILAEASAVLTGRGPRHVFVELAHTIRSSTQRLDFDAILEALPSFARSVTRVSGDGVGPSPSSEGFEIILAGWSERGHAHEAWVVQNYDGDGYQAFAPARLPECYLDELPPKTCENFGLRMPSAGECQWRQEPFKYALLNIAASRFCPSRVSEEDADAWIAVGGFVQVTRISRHAAASEIMMEWPDPIGLRIDPQACLQGLEGEAWAERVFGPLGRWENEHAH